jgi:hypothetical protein
VGLLRSKDTQTAFKISLSNRFQPLQELNDSETDIESLWEQGMKLWLNTCEEVLGKKTQHKEWISSDTINRIKKKGILNIR